MKKIKVSIIGCGAIVRRGHLPALRKLSEKYEVEFLFDINYEAAVSVRNEFNMGKPICDKRQFNSTSELAVVAVPTPFHFETIMWLIERGIKYILVEKPLTLSYKDSLRVFKEAEEQGTIITVVQNYRYIPSVRKLKAMIEEGLLGNILFLNGRAFSKCPIGWTRGEWFYTKEVGVIYDFFPHLVDLVSFICPSNVVSVNAVSIAGGMCVDFPVSISSVIQLGNFSQGSIASLMASWQTGVNEFTLEVIGDAGSAWLDVRNDVLFTYTGPRTLLEDGSWFWANLKSKLSGLITGKLFSGALEMYRILYEDLYETIMNKKELFVKKNEILQTDYILDAIRSAIL